MSSYAGESVVDGKERNDVGSYANGYHHVPNCHCHEKIRQLSVRFSETRRLLKLNKIKGLGSKPPSFLPSLPPANDKEQLSSFKLPRPQLNSSAKSLTNNHSEDVDTVNHSFYKGQMDHDHSLNTSSSFLHQSKLNCSRSMDHSIDGSHESKLDWTGSLDSLRLCNRCSSNLSETIEDLPKLLPTDALNRPYLGLSYSMEDDLSPGVKEIRHSAVATSTPKSDLSSSPSLHRSKEESGLSTFSQSVSSLGYVSSQSDWEINHLPNVPDKIPVSNFRSMTLPNGLDRSPFYSATEEFYLHPKQKVEGARDPRIEHFAAEETQSRSSSAPPPPEVEKPKKHFRVFSRKSKKDKNKSGATP